jgi:twinkle protein
MGKDLIPGEYVDLKKRGGISRKTCEFYGYQVNKERMEHIANFYNASGQAIGQQIRTQDKKFYFVGDTSVSDSLWGAHLFTPNQNVFITITEGQIDALSVAEVFERKYPVVSLPNGAKNAANVLLKNKKYLEGFKYVVLAFDADKDGRDAVDSCLKVLAPGTVRIARFDHKDANEYYKQGLTKELRDVIYQATAYSPPAVLTGQSLMDTLNGYKRVETPWPWRTANETISQIRRPAVYTIGSHPGVGKTILGEEIIRATVGSGGRIGIVPLEKPIQEVILKVTDTLMGTNLMQIVNREFTEQEKAKCQMVAERLVVYDHITYGSSLTDIIDNLPYMAKVYGCEIIIFDNLSFSSSEIGGDERRSIDVAMKQLKNSTTVHNYTLLNIVHIKRDSPVSAESIRGSQGIEMYSDYILGLSRDTTAEDDMERNTVHVEVLKDRFSGKDKGKTFKLYYNRDSGHLEDFI